MYTWLNLRTTHQPHPHINETKQALWRLLLPTLPSRRGNRRQQQRAQEKESLTYTSFSTSVEGWDDGDEEGEWDVNMEIEEWEGVFEEEEVDDSFAFYAFDRAAAEAEFFGAEWVVAGQEQQQPEAVASDADASTCAAGAGGGGSCGVAEEQKEGEEGTTDAMAALLARSTLGRVVARIGGEFVVWDGWRVHIHICLAPSPHDDRTERTDQHQPKSTYTHHSAARPPAHAGAGLCCGGARLLCAHRAGALTYMYI